MNERLAFEAIHTYRSRKPPEGACWRVLEPHRPFSTEGQGCVRSYQMLARGGLLHFRTYSTLGSHSDKDSSLRSPWFRTWCERPGYWSISRYVHLLAAAKSNCILVRGGCPPWGIHSTKFAILVLVEVLWIFLVAETRMIFQMFLCLSLC